MSEAELLRTGQDEARRDILRRVLSTHGPLAHDWLLARYPWEAEWLDAALDGLIDSGEAVSGPITNLPTAQGPEYCDRRNLERIHRHTLSILRKEVEPVSLYDYADFLARWQHLHPAERLSGPGALVRLLQQMRGVPAPGVIWERDLLSLRLGEFDAAELKALCEGGEVVWAGSGGKDPRRARVRFLFRGEGHLFLAPAEEEPDLSPTAVRVLDLLKSEGACFFADLEAGTGLPNAELSAALVELVMQGLVTNDTLDALHGVLAWSSAASEGGAEGGRTPLSSLEAELSAWRQERSPSGGREQTIRHPGRGRLHAARRTVARRLEGTASPRWRGRWSLVHRLGVWGQDSSFDSAQDRLFEDRITRQARQLLQCYGIVTRQSLERDDQAAWNWGVLYAQFQLMEMRGEVRRGYFVQGLPGIQFALPEAVERLREWTRPPGQDVGRDGAPPPAVPEGKTPLVLLNACDPANLFGPALTGVDALADAEASADAEAPDGDPGHDPARFARIPANYVVLLRGRPILLLETGGQRATALPGLPGPTLRQALELAVAHLGPRMRRLTVAHWNGEPVLNSPAAALLEATGFRRDALVYVWES